MCKKSYGDNLTDSEVDLRPPFTIFEVKNGNRPPCGNLESLSYVIDWDFRRYEIAKSILVVKSRNLGYKQAAEESIAYADELIRQLKEGMK